VTDLLRILRDRSTVGVTRCHGGVEETEVTRLFFWVNPTSDKSPETRRLRGRTRVGFLSKNLVKRELKMQLRTGLYAFELTLRQYSDESILRLRSTLPTCPISVTTLSNKMLANICLLCVHGCSPKTLAVVRVVESKLP